MNYIKETRTYTSSNEKSTITYYTYTPTHKIIGLFQISHGMCEYIERYEHFIEFLIKKGFLVFGNDHLGHKGSVAVDSELGHFPHDSNDTNLVQDIVILSQKIKGQYPNLPLFLMGHSMGSFIARLAYAEHSDLYNGLIICGTGYKIYTQLYRIAKLLLKTTSIFKSKEYRSPVLDKLVFGKFAKSVEDAETEQDWICANPETVEQYRQDKYCMFSFSASALQTLLTLCQKANSKKCFAATPKEKPILMISGQEDHLGGKGKGIDSIEKHLKKQKIVDIQKIIYPEMRHEILNEIDKQIVFNDIEQWLQHALDNLEK